jgi:hypothetical protein
MKHYKIINITNSFNNSFNQFAGNDGFNIISYNVSWEAMTSNINSNVKLCSNDICKINILDNIAYNIKKYNPLFAFFQEASEHYDIIDLFNNDIYANFVNTSEKEFMVSIWNKQKFTLIKASNGEFEKGRPFAIIILKNNKSKKNIALINLHAGHFIDSQLHIFDIINNFIKKEFNYNIKKSITRVIMSGDFNRNIFEDNTSNYIIKFIDEFKLKRYNHNKYTCCSMLNYGHKFNYDHVLDSKAIIIKKILGNSISKYKYPASDHILIITNLKS